MRRDSFGPCSALQPETPASPMALTLHHLPPSPNNLRVRLALGYKGLSHKSVPFRPDGMPGDRSAFVELSGQPRLPILLHDGAVVFDSFSILRYLDANFRATPRLYSSDYATQGAIDEWELYARTGLAEPMGTLFGQALGGSPDPAVLRTAGGVFHERTQRIEERLGESRFLEGEALTAADLAAAPIVSLGALSEEQAATSPILGFFRGNLALGDGRDRTADWLERVLAYDGQGAE